ncbi:MAG: hypothetical protein HZB26_26315 [Candidatus Hydrogenedentes bacterium]|nr:hypothetical protein [Candidatus Hydrogenedentota bacterium]
MPRYLVVLLTMFTTASLASYGAEPAKPETPNPAKSIKVTSFEQEVAHFYRAADGLPDDDVTSVIAADDGSVIAVTPKGAAKFSGGKWTPAGGPVPAAKPGPDKAAILALSNGVIQAKGNPELMLNAAPRTWGLDDLRAAAYDKQGKGVWFASLQGVGHFDGKAWSLYTGQDGLPYNDFTCVAAGERPEVVWFGTKLGAIRFDGKSWEYRQGLRWLPNDEVRAIAVTAKGDAWFATKKGVGLIERRTMTLAEKAKFYEDEIDKYNRRTPYGYVLECSVKNPGDKSEHTNHDSDNDGLWTAMYGAGECFAYAATKSPESKKRAKDAFEALRFLGVVTQGGTPPAEPGFSARTILPASGPNPNTTHYTPEKDRKERETGDHYWKVMDPRWPKSADGQWYWKSDTSSDELDGHYFFYALYYDLVADTPEEKDRARKVVTGITDHLLRHGFNYIDWDGKPTRWAIYGPEYLNQDTNFIPGRGLNSLSIMSYLVTAEHMTGDAKYRDAINKLNKDHAYAGNIYFAKPHRGAGSGNQSDDEMAFMGYYNLLQYEKDPELANLYRYSFWNYWRLEMPELNPFFNFTYAAVCSGKTFKNAFGEWPVAPYGSWLTDAVETLERFPLDRFNWAHKNSHRLDLVPLPHWTAEVDQVKEAADGSLKIPVKGYRVNGKTLPVDETFFNHWNTDPWDLDYGGSGNGLADGAVYLLPYYMGLYHGYIVEK